MVFGEGVTPPLIFRDERSESSERILTSGAGGAETLSGTLGACGGEGGTNGRITDSLVRLKIFGAMGGGGGATGLIGGDIGAGGAGGGMGRGGIGGGGGIGRGGWLLPIDKGFFKFG